LNDDCIPQKVRWLWCLRTIFQALADAKNTAKRAFRAFQPIENKGSKRRHLDTHTPPDIGEFVRAQIVAQKDQPNHVTFTLPDGRKGRVSLGAGGIGDARHWRLNIAEADRIDRLAIAHQRKTWPVDIIGGPRRGQVDQHLRYGILDVERALIDEDQSRAGAPQGDGYPLTYDASGYPELPACLDRPPWSPLAKAA